MDHSRVLRITNVVLLLTAYQMHWFEKKSQRFRLSLPGVVNILVLGVIYAGCFSQHFNSTSSLLNVLNDVSPFLFVLTRTQLFLGAKVFAYSVYSSVKSVGAVNSLVESLPTRNSGLRKDEVIAYVLLGSTFGTLFCFVLYISYEMKFELPPLQDAMVGMALFLPHLILSGSLRLYIILAWLTRGQLKQFKNIAEEELSDSLIKDEANVASTSFTISTKSSSVENLENLKRKLEILGANFRFFFQSIQHSLIFLFAINGNCLLGGIYSYTYYWNSWHVIFEDRKRRIFYAANASIYACIASDYICLMVVLFMMEKERMNFIKCLDFFLAKRNSLSKRMRSIAKDTKNVLKRNFFTKFHSIIPLNISYVSLMVFLQLLIITLIVMFHYLNDAIILLKEELNSKDDN
ncbi:uncharacterized protein LOC119546211 [Drosophila subpulchrella]|uniref:uncharacterized protein LOC119546211 n=1 Tax=Drosophila subpulchrella TaxID=1486046 RepID=UPI0018A16D96|nr:uncharacterized protein LOC119546211 [Drosophila subpulchrella]